MKNRWIAHLISKDLQLNKRSYLVGIHPHSQGGIIRVTEVVQEDRSNQDTGKRWESSEGDWEEKKEGTQSKDTVSGGHNGHKEQTQKTKQKPGYRYTLLALQQFLPFVLSNISIFSQHE